MRSWHLCEKLPVAHLGLLGGAIYDVTCMVTRRSPDSGRSAEKVWVYLVNPCHAGNLLGGGGWEAEVRWPKGFTLKHLPLVLTCNRSG